LLELPTEIVAKKIFYRGKSLQPRDMFDIASVIECFGEDALLSALRPYSEPCGQAATAATAMDREFVFQVMNQLQVREAFRHIPDIAQKVTIDFLKRVAATNEH